MLGLRRKALEPLCRSCVKPRPSHYNSTLLKKLVVFLKTVELFNLQPGRTSSLFGKLCYGIVEAVVFGRRAVRFKERAVSSEPPSTTKRSLLWEGWSSLNFSRDTARKKNVLAVWEALPKQGGSCGICERAVASLPSSASEWSPPSASKKSLSAL